jgi:hypothetical protein
MRFRFVLSIGVLALAGLAQAEIPHPPALILTSQENGTEAENTFSCSGTIHGYVTLSKAAIGKHVLEGIWTGPKGTIIQHTRDELNFSPPGSRITEIWLRFTKEGGRLWNPISVQDPGDEDRALYDGSWTIEVRWDDRAFARSVFQIHCL